eukprot:158581-Pelagomonas_calceolata.AAC.3
MPCLLGICVGDACGRGVLAAAITAASGPAWNHLHHQGLLEMAGHRRGSRACSAWPLSPTTVLGACS